MTVLDGVLYTVRRWYLLRLIRRAEEEVEFAEETFIALTHAMRFYEQDIREKKEQLRKVKQQMED